jgi:hypothetical protein
MEKPGDPNFTTYSDLARNIVERVAPGLSAPDSAFNKACDEVLGLVTAFAEYKRIEKAD